MMNKKNVHVIWSAFPDYDEWGKELRAEEPDLTDDQVYARMYSTNNDYLDDERANLDGIRYNMPILVISQLGLWNGTSSGYGEIRSGKVTDCLCSWYEPEWYVTADGEFCCADHHHDGVNHYWYRVWKDGVTEDQMDELKEKLYENTYTTEDIDALTRPIGPDIAKVYGFELVPREVALAAG